MRVLFLGVSLATKLQCCSPGEGQLGVASLV